MDDPPVREFKSESDVSFEEAVFELRKMYRDVGARAAELVQVHQDRLKCERGCSQCCVDGLSVFEIEARHIEHHFGSLLESGRAAEEGGCAFLDGAGGCRIYSCRPYVCRTQGLPLRWLAEKEDSLVEFRDICPLNDEGPPVESLSEEDCWTLGPFEEKLARLQSFLDGGEMRRIPLRTLFHSREIEP